MKTPTMVLKYPGKHQFQDGSYDYQIVDESDVDAALAEGWFRTKEEAKQAYKAPTPVAELVKDMAALADNIDAPPTRAELEQKAKELGLKFDGRTTDKKLAALIAEKV